jgi:AmiR/NasT family two-component response regulator
LGHEVIAREVEVAEVGAVTAREQPDIALVGLGLYSEHALDLIGKIVHEAACPVVALRHEHDPAYVREAARRGVFAYIVDGSPEELPRAPWDAGRGSNRQKASSWSGTQFGAKKAFDLLRDQSQRSGRRLADIAAAIVRSHQLLSGNPESPGLAPPSRDGGLASS